MAIDGCKHSFQTLANVILPRRMKQMRRAMARARPMRVFVDGESGLKGIKKTLNIAEDFSGCYVFLRRRKPIYVGISRRVLHRIRSHIQGDSHNTATLAYQLADEGTDLKLTRAEKMKQPGFRKSFDQQKSRMKAWAVAWVEVENPVELHLFEVYCAMKLNTSRRNTFRTH